MKKRLISLLVVSALLLCSCGTNDDSKKESKKDSQKTESTQNNNSEKESESESESNAPEELIEVRMPILNMDSSVSTEDYLEEVRKTDADGYEIKADGDEFYIWYIPESKRLSEIKELEDQLNNKADTLADINVDENGQAKEFIANYEFSNDYKSLKLYYNTTNIAEAPEAAMGAVLGATMSLTLSAMMMQCLNLIPEENMDFALEVYDSVTGEKIQ